MRGQETILNRRNRRTRAMLRSIQLAGARITTIIARPVDNPATWAPYARKIREINLRVRQIKEHWAGFVQAELPVRFREGQAIARRVLRGIPRVEGAYLVKVQKAVQDQALLDMFDGLDAGKRDVVRLFRLTQQHAIAEAKINEAIRRGAIEGTPKALKSEVLKALEKRVGDGKIITVNTQTGKRRRFSADTYAELVARTRTREAQTAGTVQTTLEHGQDLVQVSAHNTSTKICIPHEGMVYSISGNSGKYPRLGEVTPFHPNCRHVMTPYVESDAGTQRGQDQAARLAAQKAENDARLAALEKPREEVAA